MTREKMSKGASSPRLDGFPSPPRANVWSN